MVGQCNLYRRLILLLLFNVKQLKQKKQGRENLCFFVKKRGKKNFGVYQDVGELKEYPDRLVVLAASDDYFQLYRYSPSKAVDPVLLEQAKEDGKIGLEDGYATSGQAVWNTFFNMSSEGKHVSAEIVHYYTLENGNYDETYYEVYKEDYPDMYIFDLTYGTSVLS